MLRAVNRRKRNILLATAGLMLAGTAYYLLNRFLVGILCVFSLITGLHCPGCGNTAAVVQLLKGDIPGALRENYLFPLEFFYLGWVYVFTARQYYKTGKVSYKSVLPGLDAALLILIVLWGLVRNFFSL